jgi:tRNA dimethylallyltransferase
MVNEVKKLHKNGVSWKRLGELGLEYRFIALYLQKKITKQEMIDQLRIAIGQYAKRQITWFKKDESIIWLPPTNTANKNLMDAKKIIEKFLKNQ